MNITSDLIAKHKLTKPEQNLLARIEKIVTETRLQILVSTGNASRANLFSGKSVSLEPLAQYLHDFILQSFLCGMVGIDCPVSIYDRARYLFLRLWPEAYSDLID